MDPEVIELPLRTRGAEVMPASVNAEARTVEVIWTTGATVRRARFWDEPVDEELIVDAAAVRLDRLNSGAPFLNSHNAWELDAVLGVVVDGSARIEGGQGLSTIRFSQRADVEPIWQDIVGGIIRNVSVGYRVHRYEITKRDGQVELWRAVDWEPMEISAVAIGADPGAQVRAAEGRAGVLNPCTVVRHGVNAAQGAAHSRGAIMENDVIPVAGSMAATTPAAALTDVSRAALATALMPAPVSADAIRAEERARALAITEMVTRHALGADLATDLISRGVSLDAARTTVLERIADRDTRGLGNSTVTPRGMDETETRRRGMEEALSFRLGGATELTERARPYAQDSIVDLAAARLGERRVPGSFGQREDLLQRAFHTTSDFPLLLANALNNGLAARYRYAQPTYRRIARQRTYQDFRPHNTVRIGDFPDLLVVDPDGGELQGGTFSEAREMTNVKAYGVRVNISRALLVNDTLHGIEQVLNDRGMAVARFEEKVAYGVILSGASNNGPTMLETTRQMFNTTDGTLAAAAAAITNASLGLGRAALVKRTSKDGNLLDLTAQILLVGADKQTEAQQIVAPIQAAQAANVNVFSGVLDVITTARITGNAWYLFADPAVAPNFEWGLLDGYTAPRFRLDEPFGIQGMSLSLEHDFGFGAIDFRGGYRNAGA
jgi:hypothetical protein